LGELDRLNADVLTEPDNAAKLIRAGEIMMAYGDPEEGVLRILTGLDHDPTNATGLELLASHYVARAERDTAYQHLATEFQQRLTDAVKTDTGQTAP
jgi:predicted Zn-dependent protease